MGMCLLWVVGNWMWFGSRLVGNSLLLVVGRLRVAVGIRDCWEGVVYCVCEGVV